MLFPQAGDVRTERKLIEELLVHLMKPVWMGEKVVDGQRLKMFKIRSEEPIDFANLRVSKLTCDKNDTWRLTLKGCPKDVHKNCPTLERYLRHYTHFELKVRGTDK